MVLVRGVLNEPPKWPRDLEEQHHMVPQTQMEGQTPRPIFFHFLGGLQTPLTKTSNSLTLLFTVQADFLDMKDVVEDCAE